jgi:site-specific recombinase XerD
MILAKRKNGIYYIQYFDNEENRIRRISTGERIKKNAYKFLSEFRSNLKSRSLVKYISLKKFKDEYMIFMSRTHSQKYLSSINLSFNQLIRFTGDVPLKQITPKVTQSFLSETYTRTKKGAALYCRTLKASFTRAIDWSYLEENPFIKLSLPKMEKSFPVFITESELEIILGNTPNKILKDLFFTAFHTGMRLGELVNLRWIAVDFSRKMMTVKNDESFSTKSRRERIIPISKKLFSEILKKYQKLNLDVGADYVFQKVKGVKLNQEWVSKDFKKAVRKSKLDERIHFHTLRHSFASNLVQKGASIYVVKELMGHSDISTTQIYSHLRKENLVDAIRLLD